MKDQRTSRSSIFTRKFDPSYSGQLGLNFSGSYGFAVWLVWIGGGCFLPAAALAFEGGFINEKGFNYAELMG